MLYFSRKKFFRRPKYWHKTVRRCGLWNKSFCISRKIDKKGKQERRIIPEKSAITENSKKYHKGRKKDRKNLKGQIILKLEKSRRIERSVKNWQNIVEFVTRKELIQISWTRIISLNLKESFLNKYPMTPDTTFRNTLTSKNVDTAWKLGETGLTSPAKNTRQWRTCRIWKRSFECMTESIVIVIILIFSCSCF